MSLYDYNNWPNFTKDELICQHTGLENPNIDEFTELMDDVQAIRNMLGIPFTVTSAYRHETHPIEARKDKPGMHNLAAIDIRVPVEYCYKLVMIAIAMDFRGIGINLTGDPNQRFIHLDKRKSDSRIWSY